MSRSFFFLILLCSVSLLFSACDKDDPEIPNEEELITTVTYTLSPSSGGDDVVLTFKDLDGDGDETPVITGGTLSNNMSYTGKLELLNEAEETVEDITVEILEEDEDHQFFFESDVAGLEILYDDSDADGNPVGLSSTLNTADAASGSITIILRHEPEKTAAGVAGGDISNAGGETDIEVTFPIDVE